LIIAFFGLSPPHGVRTTLHALPTPLPVESWILFDAATAAATPSMLPPLANCCFPTENPTGFAG